MGKIEDIRSEIDKVDGKILKLLERRAKLACKLKEEKEKRRLPIFNAEREWEKLKTALKRKSILPPEGKKAVFTEIISATRSLEKKFKVGFLGPEGSFSHEASKIIFGSSIEFVPKGSIIDVFEDVEKGKIDVGVIPIESSQDGSVGETLDCLMDFNLKIIRATLMSIRLCLVSKEQTISSVKKVISHEKAISQAKTWLRVNMPNAAIDFASSTSEAAEIVSKTRGMGAISSKISAEIFGLNILAEDIQGKVSYTRFIAIAKEGCSGRDKSWKTSLCFTLKHKPGALFKALKPFAERGINLTKIESRPLKNTSFEYAFFVDIEGSESIKKVTRALKELAKVCTSLKVLGSYPYE